MIKNDRKKIRMINMAVIVKLEEKLAEINFSLKIIIALLLHINEISPEEFNQFNELVHELSILISQDLEILITRS